MGETTVDVAFIVERGCERAPFSDRRQRVLLAADHDLSGLMRFRVVQCVPVHVEGGPFDHASFQSLIPVDAAWCCGSVVRVAIGLQLSHRKLVQEGLGSVARTAITAQRRLAAVAGHVNVVIAVESASFWCCRG